MNRLGRRLTLSPFPHVLAVVRAAIRSPARLSRASAFTAKATAIRRRVQVAAAVRVALRAVGLRAVERDLTAHVHFPRHNLQMVGVHAGPVAAQVVKRHPFGDWPDQNRVHYAMRPPSAPEVVDLTVTIRDAATIPQPAAIGLRGDLGQDSNPSGFHIHATIIPEGGP